MKLEIPELDLTFKEDPCEKCYGGGKDYTYSRTQKCSRCNGRGWLITELGKSILELITYAARNDDEFRHELKGILKND